MRAGLDGRLLPGVANLGSRPTLGADEKLSLEVHILGFDENIYGAEIEVFFEAFLRPEQAFPGLDELRQAITGDIEKAVVLLGL